MGLPVLILMSLVFVLFKYVKQQKQILVGPTGS